MGEFNYESKIWGANEVSGSPTDLSALSLKYCLEAIKGIHGRLIDVGCGAGGLTKAIKKQRPDLEVWGVDVSRASIQQANKDPAGVKFYVGNIYKIPYPNEYFDVVVFFDVLEHLDEPQKALNEINRVTKSGGMLHIFVPCENQPFTLHKLLSRFGWRAKKKYAGHVQLFSFEEVKKLLKNSKFLIKNYQWSHHFLNQAADVSYFSLLALRGKNLPYSVESYISFNNQSTSRKFLRASKNIVGFLSYYESILFKKIPGLGVHVTAIKNQHL